MEEYVCSDLLKQDPVQVRRKQTGGKYGVQVEVLLHQEVQILRPLDLLQACQYGQVEN